MDTGTVVEPVIPAVKMEMFEKVTRGTLVARDFDESNTGGSRMIGTPQKRGRESYL
jgi:hypothetical protein